MFTKLNWGFPGQKEVSYQVQGLLSSIGASTVKWGDWHRTWGFKSVFCRLLAQWLPWANPLTLYQVWASIWNSCNSHMLLPRAGNWYNYFGKQCGSSYKVKYTLIMLLRILPLGVSPRELKTCPLKNLCRNVYSSFIHHSSKPGTAQISISRWMYTNCDTHVQWNII